MTTDALEQTLDTIRAEEAVRGVRRTQEPIQTCVYIIADATWDASLHPSHEDFLDEGTRELKYRIIDALDARGLSYRYQRTYAWMFGPNEGLIELAFGAR